MDITLIQVDPVTSRVFFKMSPKLVKGISELIQTVVLSLLNVPGRDILDPDDGGGIPEMIGMNFDSTDLNDILAEITRRVRKTESEIMTNQIGLTIDPSTKLRSIEIISVTPGASEDEVSVKLRIINELGQQSNVVL